MPIFQHFSLAYVCHPLNYRTGESSQPDTGPCYSRLSCSLRSCREKLVIYFEHHCSALPSRSVCLHPRRSRRLRRDRWLRPEPWPGQGRGCAPPGQEGMERVPPMLSSFPEAPPGADAPCGSFQTPLSHEDTLLSWCCSPGCDGSQEHTQLGKLCTLNGNDHSNPRDSAGCWEAG